MKNAIIYDFDGTLTPFTFPKFEILEKCGIKDGMLNKDFMLLVKTNLEKYDNDSYKAIFKTYFEILKNCELTNDNISLGADKVIYNKGVIEFLEFLNKNNIANYLVSSSVKVYLDKTRVAPYFKKIFATTFIYQDDKAIDIEYLMNDKKKVDAIKKIEEEYNCQDIIYIGDGYSDYYAMKYVKENGGKVIFVYNDENNKDINLIKEKKIVDLFTKADFSSNSELTKYIKTHLNIK